ncbi:MAG TPA: hypothetical protein DCR14_10540 [Acidimicrobiaceae bacterium]|nr:hypothetical protein [Acidimicrobiaceae bacterium]
MNTTTTDGTGTRTKVVIVGGGPSGLSTAFHLTDPTLNPRHAEVDVSIYQIGWRLGGKGATGRDPKHDRILEHGIHAFTGFYWNSTSMLDSAYRALADAHADAQAADRRPLGQRLPRSIEEALIPSDTITITNYYKGRQSTRQLVLPVGTGDHPWENPHTPTEAELLTSIAEWSMSLVEAIITTAEHTHPWMKWLLSGPQWVERKLVKELRVALEHAREGRHHHMLDAFTAVVKWLTDHALKPTDKWDTVRLAFNVIDYYATVTRGLIADGLLKTDGTHAADLDAIDAMNYTDWLTKHGLHEMTMQSSIPHNAPYVCFSLPDGDGSRLPTMSAATFLLWELRNSFFRRNHFYFFRVGTGETVIKPLYEALLARNVNVEFFHKLIGVTFAADGETVEELHFQRQARVINAPYRPMRPAQAGFGDVWPDEPLWDQLVDGDHIRDVIRGSAPQPNATMHAVDDAHPDQIGGMTCGLESAWCPWQPDDTVTLRRGTDFDIAVIAIPPPAVAHFAPTFAEHPVMRTAVDELDTVQTLQVHLWFASSPEEMGLGTPKAEKATSGPQAVNRFTTVTLPDPLNGLVDYSDTMEWEYWPDGGPRSMIQACGPVQELHLKAATWQNPNYPQQAWMRAAAITGQWMRTAGITLTKAQRSRPTNSLSFDFDALWHEDDDHRGEQRLWSQFVRLNIDPSELYVLAPKGTAAVRPKPWDIGPNLAVAGDWVYTGINIGSFEGAVMSGKLAAYAITGYPTIDQVYGYTMLHGDKAPVNDKGPMIDRLQR